MSNLKNKRKVRFLPFFPYGFCSRLATTITGENNPYATLLLLGNDPEQTLAQCKSTRENLLERTKYLCKKDYAKDVLYACDTPKTSHAYRRLTKKGLAVLIEAPDQIAQERFDDEESDISQYEQENDGNIKGCFYRSNSMDSIELQQLLHYYATSDKPEHAQAFQDLLLEAVINERITPLSSAMKLAEDVKITTNKYSRNQLYNIWRLSHVNAMFRANDFLTYLDRRPYDTGFAIDGITDWESYDAYVQKYGLTMAAFTYYALKTWYSNNPDFYRIKQTQPGGREKAEKEWLNTPAFYWHREITEPAEDHDTDEMQDKYRTRYSRHIGLATGRNINYMCYHGKGGPLKWLPKTEAEAKADIEETVRRMKTQCPEMICNDNVDFALYFCSSHHQFLALFDRTKAKHTPGKKLPTYPLSEPYTSIHAVPVNDSGTFQLKLLLLYSPMEADTIIQEQLTRYDPGFQYRTDLWYPLTYQGKRVFTGYTMDIVKINRVLEDYLDGQDFYICCFPEQAQWYRMLFPGITIL